LFASRSQGLQCLYKQKGSHPKDTPISGSFQGDLLHGRRALSFDIARSLHKVLGVPADIVLA
jgi:antitoxin component HigA of HigAB toxin-antitoxin module